VPSASFLRQRWNDRELHGFIDENLQPTGAFIRKCNEKTDALAAFLKEKTTFSVSEVFKV